MMPVWPYRPHPRQIADLLASTDRLAVWRSAIDHGRQCFHQWPEKAFPRVIPPVRISSSMSIEAKYHCTIAPSAPCSA